MSCKSKKVKGKGPAFSCFRESDKRNLINIVQKKNGSYHTIDDNRNDNDDEDDHYLFYILNVIN